MIKKILLIGTILLSLCLVGCNKGENKVDEINDFIKIMKLPSIELLENIDNDSLLSDIYIPSSVETKHGTVRIFWESSNYNAVDNDGHVSRSLLEDKVVELTPSVILKGRNRVREDLKCIFTVLKYSLKEFEMPTIVFSEEDTIFDIKNDIEELPKVASVEDIKVAVTWNISTPNNLENILDTNGKVTRHFSRTNEKAKVVLTPTIHYNDDSLQLDNFSTIIYITPYGIEEAIEKSIHTFPNIVFSNGDTANQVTRDIKNMPLLWYLGYEIFIDISWKSTVSNVIEIKDGTGEIKIGEASKTTILIPKIAYYYNDQEGFRVDVERELTENQIEIFIPGTKIPLDLNGHSFRNAKYGHVISFNESTFTYTKDDNYITYSTFGQYNKSGFYLDIQFDNDTNLENIYGLVKNMTLNISLNSIKMNLLEENEVLDFFESGIISHGSLVTDKDKYYGKYGEIGIGNIIINQVLLLIVTQAL